MEFLFEFNDASLTISSAILIAKNQILRRVVQVHQIPLFQWSEQWEIFIPFKTVSWWFVCRIDEKGRKGTYLLNNQPMKADFSYVLIEETWQFMHSYSMADGSVFLKKLEYYYFIFYLFKFRLCQLNSSMECI